MSPATPAPLELAAGQISGAAWVLWHPHSRRLFCWHQNAEAVQIINGDTGELMALWWCDNATLTSAQATVQERLNAGY